MRSLERTHLSLLVLCVFFFIFTQIAFAQEQSKEHEARKAELLKNLQAAKNPEDTAKQSKLLSLVIDKEPELIRNDKMVRDALTTVAQKDPSILKLGLGEHIFGSDKKAEILKNWLGSYGVKMIATSGTFSGSWIPTIEKIGKVDGKPIAYFTSPPVSFPLEGIAKHNPQLWPELFILGNNYVHEGTIRIKDDKPLYLKGTVGTISSPDDLGLPLANYGVISGAASLEEIDRQIRSKNCQSCLNFQIKGAEYSFNFAPGVEVTLSTGQGQYDARYTEGSSYGLFYRVALPRGISGEFFGTGPNPLQIRPAEDGRTNFLIGTTVVGAHFTSPDKNTLLKWTTGTYG